MRTGLSSQLSGRQETRRIKSGSKKGTSSKMLQPLAEAKKTDTSDKEATEGRNRSNTEEVMVVKDESDLFLDTGAVDKVPSILCAFEDEDPVSVPVSKALDKQMLLAQVSKEGACARRYMSRVCQRERGREKEREEEKREKTQHQFRHLPSLPRSNLSHLQMKAHFQGLAEAMANGNEVDISYEDTDGGTFHCTSHSLCFIYFCSSA